MGIDIPVSIIIVNYNTENLLKDCLASVVEKTLQVKYEIIVVDNNSKKESLDELINLYSNVKFELLSDNLGFGRANNKGVEIAKGRYLFFLNPDTILLNDAISILYNYMEDNKSVGACGGSLLNEDLSPGLSYFPKNRMWQEYQMLLSIGKDTEYELEQNIKQVYGIMGADLLVRKDLFIAIKGFDPMFFMYFEESELCFRIRKRGYQIMFVPDASIIHIQGAASEKKSEDLKKWSYQEHWLSKWLFFYKTEGSFKTSIIYAVHIMRSNLAIVIYNIKKREEKLNYWTSKKNIIKKTYCQYRKKVRG